MSKLSVHISDSPQGLGELLRKCAQAKSPIPIIYSLNQNIADTIAQNSPGTKWIYRRQSGIFHRVPGNFFEGDPVQSARNWLTETKDPKDQGRTQVENWELNRQVSGRNPPEWYDPLNEPAIEIADLNNPQQVADAVRKAQFLNTWMITALTIADGLHFKLALFSFASESLPLDQRVWSELIPALRLGKQLHAILSLHAYGGAPNGTHGPLHDRPQAYLRHRDIFRLLPEDAQLPVVYTECGAGNGFNVGQAGKGLNFITDLAACDADWMADVNVLGACAFQLGTGDKVESNMAGILGPYGDYISTHPTLVTASPI